MFVLIFGTIFCVNKIKWKTKQKYKKTKYREQPSGGRASAANAAPPPAFAPQNQLPPEWRVYYNPQGIPYYYNVMTGETTWRPPF